MRIKTDFEFEIEEWVILIGIAVVAFLFALAKEMMK